MRDVQKTIRHDINNNKSIISAHTHTLRCKARVSLMALIMSSAVAAFLPASASASDVEPLSEEEEVAYGFTEKIIKAFKEGDILFDGRLRYERNDQDFIPSGPDPDAANALTFRARFGFETGDFYGLKLLAEGDFTRALGVDDFNSIANGLTEFPVIADPDSERLNRFHFTYEGVIPETKIIAGRQRIKLDNDRFIGNVGFRQNEQTYDGVRVQNTIVDNLTLDYSYIYQVNRIFGSESEIGTEDTNSHFINASYALPFGKVTGYAYLLDFEDALVNASSANFGGRIDLKHKLNDDLSLGLIGEFANQTDFADAAADFDHNYYLIQGSATYKNLTFKAAFEVLEGDGTTAFSTPLATLHAFQGDADVFIVTPADGIEDLQFGLDYKIKDVPVVGDTRVRAVYHRFTSENTDADLGDEFDFGIYTNPLPGVSASIEYADFRSDTVTLSDTQRLFLTLGFKF